jgi:ribose 5-phosphate isomerase B
MTIAFGNDHSGFPLKSEVLRILADYGAEVIDHGCHSSERVDFPNIVADVCRTITDGKAERGILLCGTGIGASMAANKTPGIRAGLCHDTYCAHQGVEHDDMNVMCLGAMIVGPWLAKDLISAFLDARFSDEVHFRRRVDMLRDMDSSMRPSDE